MAKTRKEKGKEAELHVSFQFLEYLCKQLWNLRIILRLNYSLLLIAWKKTGEILKNEAFTLFLHILNNIDLKFAQKLKNKKGFFKFFEAVV